MTVGDDKFYFVAIMAVVACLTAIITIKTIEYGEKYNIRPTVVD